MGRAGPYKARITLNEVSEADCRHEARAFLREIFLYIDIESRKHSVDTPMKKTPFHFRLAYCQALTLNL